jgi:hypothetical protein
MASSNDKQMGSGMALPASAVRSDETLRSIAYPLKMDFANALK